MSDIPKLVLSTSPFQKRVEDTPSVMRHVLLSLAPALLGAFYYFGISALLVVLTCVVGCVATEWLVKGRGSLRYSTVADGSAVVTAVLLAMTLPPGIPLWMALLGSVVAILFGKALFGGLGHNVFNPSLTGRAFLQASFPVALTTWTAQSGAGDLFRLRGDTFALPFTTPVVDVVTTATPLSRMKFDGVPTAVSDLLFGHIPGSIGETSALLLLLGGAYLAYRRFLKWRIPVGIFATVIVFSSILHWVNPSANPTPWQHLFSGGLVLGAVFMATDPVTSPVTPSGSWLFAIGVGVLTICIRQFGGLPEGVMYSILLMNSLSPLIDRVTQPRVYGTARALKRKEAGS